MQIHSLAPIVAKLDEVTVGRVMATLKIVFFTGNIGIFTENLSVCVPAKVDYITKVRNRQALVNVMWALIALGDSQTIFKTSC